MGQSSMNGGGGGGSGASGNGTVYYHNGVPYTYQNGVAVFHSPEAAAAAAAAAAALAAANPASPAAAAAAHGSALSPFMLSPAAAMFLPPAAAPQQNSPYNVAAAAAAAAAYQQQQQHLSSQQVSKSSSLPADFRSCVASLSSRLTGARACIDMPSKCAAITAVAKCTILHRGESVSQELENYQLFPREPARGCACHVQKFYYPGVRVIFCYLTLAPSKERIESHWWEMGLEVSRFHSLDLPP